MVVATRNRAHLLPRLVWALELQTLPPEVFELCVVDDGSRDDTARVLADLAARTDVVLRAWSLPDQRGPAAARNVAWRAAGAPVVAFTDDDCLPCPGWLAAGLALAGDGRVVIGRTCPNPAQRHRLGPYSQTLVTNDHRYFQLANAFYGTADLARAGGLDEAFTGPCGEDIDLGLRVTGLGTEPVFAGKARVYHDISDSDFPAAAKRVWGSTDIARVLAKHPVAGREYLWLRWFWSPADLSVLVALVGLVLARRVSAAAVLVGPWLYQRGLTRPLHYRRSVRLTSLPGAFALDVLTVAAMLRGGLGHRVMVL